MKKTKKLILLSLILSQALVIHYIEGYFPVLAPGAKLGLANIMTLVTLVLFGFNEALAIVLARTVIGPLLGGNPMAILYSLTGGLFSTVIMGILYYGFGKYFTMMGISTAGAVFHNIGQLLVASLVYGTYGIILTYLPILMLSAVITGYFIGLVSQYLIRFLKHRIT